MPPMHERTARICVKDMNFVAIRWGGKLKRPQIATCTDLGPDLPDGNMVGWRGSINERNGVVSWQQKSFESLRDILADPAHNPPKANKQTVDKKTKKTMLERVRKKKTRAEPWVGRLRRGEKVQGRAFENHSE